jgi:hypothetical protein
VTHEPEESTTSVAIRTFRGGRLCRIEAVTTISVAEVTQWMRDGTTVQLQGSVQRSGGGLYIPRAKVSALVHLPDQMEFG